MADMHELIQDLKEVVSKIVGTNWEYFRIKQKSNISNEPHLELLKKRKQTDWRKCCNIARKLLNAKYTQSISKLVLLTKHGKLKEILRDAQERLKSLHEATSNQKGTKGSQHPTTRQMTKKKQMVEEEINSISEDLTVILQRITDTYAADHIHHKFLTLDAEDERRLERFVFTDQMEADELNGAECSICLEPYKSQEVIATLSCGHEHHIHCIVKWLKSKPTCPYCKQYFVVRYQ